MWFRLAGFLASQAGGVPPRSPACRASGRTSQNQERSSLAASVASHSIPCSGSIARGKDRAGRGQHAGRQVYPQHRAGMPAARQLRKVPAVTAAGISDPLTAIYSDITWQPACSPARHPLLACL